MNRLAKLSARFIGNRGFSIGIDDVTPAPRLVEAKKKLVQTSYDSVQQMIAEFKTGRLQSLPGSNQEESLEQKVSDLLSSIRDTAGNVSYHHTTTWHHAVKRAVLCCTVLHCAVLCCAVLCCAVLCCAVLPLHSICHAGSKLLLLLLCCRKAVCNYCITHSCVSPRLTHP